MKGTSRVITMALAVILLVSILPLSAAAADLDLFLYPWRYSSGSDTFYNDSVPVSVPVAEKVDMSKGYNFESYDEVFYIDGVAYEHAGIHVNPFVRDKNGQVVVNSKDEALFMPYDVANGVDRLNIPPRPTTAGKEQDAWDALYNPTDTKGNNVGSYVFVTFVPHKHNTKGYGWSHDDNNHWKYCTRCAEFVYLNWHQDVDSNGICDVCKAPMVYRKLTVKPTEGGTVTLSTDKATCGTRVAVTVKPDAGYKLADIRGISSNSQGSVRPCIEDVKGSQYHMIVDVLDVEVQATFVKE